VLAEPLLNRLAGTTEGSAVMSYVIRVLGGATL